MPTSLVGTAVRGEETSFTITFMSSLIHQALQQEADGLIQAWMEQARIASPNLAKSASREAGELLDGVRQALAAGADPTQFSSQAWASPRQMLEELSRSRAAQGHSAGDTSNFILSLKRPLFAHVQSKPAADTSATIDAIWAATLLVDSMAQHTVTTFQRAREEIIVRQQEELLELSTPVVKLWDGILAVPMIGTLDSNRTQVVMETLLQKIVETESELAIIDITGVPTVDTLVAQHLLKTVTAIRLMGADCIISGIRPQIAQTIVHLGIDLKDISTKATLADALALALQKTGWGVSRRV